MKFTATVVISHVVSNPEQQPIGKPSFTEIFQKSASGKSLGRVVGKPLIESGY